MHRASATAQGFRLVARLLYAAQGNRAPRRSNGLRAAAAVRQMFLAALGCGVKYVLRNATERAVMIWHQFRARCGANLS